MSIELVDAAVNKTKWITPMSYSSVSRQQTASWYIMQPLWEGYSIAVPSMILYIFKCNQLPISKELL